MLWVTKVCYSALISKDTRSTMNLVNLSKRNENDRKNKGAGSFESSEI